MEEYMLFFKHEQIVPDKAYESMLHLEDLSTIEDGIFFESVMLYDKSKIKGGSFYNTVELRDQSVIEGGMFFDSITLFDNSKITDGIFKTIILDKDWKLDNESVKLLEDSKNIKVLIKSEQSFKEISQDEIKYHLKRKNKLASISL